MRPARLVLWDIDGTLIRSRGVGRRVFDVAVERALGHPPGDHGVSMGGKTDPQIALEILAFLHLADDDAAGHLPGVLGHLEAALAEAEAELRASGEVLAGVAELLATLDADPAVASSVLTGNTAANAAVKLGAFGLADALDLEIAAFGSDDADRLALVPIALERARRERGLELGPADVWVVGDTLNDLACARAGGARCLLVATGSVPLDELERAGPDAARADLADVDAVLTLLRS